MPEDTDDLIQQSTALRQQLLNTATQLDTWVAALKAAIDARRQDDTEGADGGDRS